MRINVAIPEAHVDAPVLDAALEATTRLDEALIKSRQVPPWDEALHKYNIRWRPEPPGDEHFDHALEVVQRGHGDCDDLAPYKAASLRVSGRDPRARARVRRSGPRRWHAYVERSNGPDDDPSKEAGMGQHSVVGMDYEGIAGAALPLMYEPPSAAVGGAYIVKPAIAMRPFEGQWQARADLPWMWREHMNQDKPTPTDYAMVTLHESPIAHTALVGALDGAVQLGHYAGFADPEHLHQLCCMSDILEGRPYDELVQVYGEEVADHATAVVGSFMGKLGKIAKGAAKGVAKGVAKGAKFAAHAAAPLVKLAKPLVKYIPGIGPVASDVWDLAEKASKAMNIPHAEMVKLLQHGDIWPSQADPSIVLGTHAALGDIFEHQSAGAHGAASLGEALEWLST